MTKAKKAKAVKAKEPEPEPEQQIAAFWRKRLPKQVYCFAEVMAEEAESRNARITDSNLELGRVRHDIAVAVAQGLPLTRAEYHLALATHTLMGERPYVQFFTTRWHETDTHAIYRRQRGCEECRSDAAADRKQKTVSKP